MPTTRCSTESDAGRTAPATSFAPDVARSIELDEAQIRAIAATAGVWNRSACGAAAGTDLRITALFHDAPGEDNFNLNGEWVEITNGGSTRTPDIDRVRVGFATFGDVKHRPERGREVGSDGI